MPLSRRNACIYPDVIFIDARLGVPAQRAPLAGHQIIYVVEATEREL
jgi:hypothetical protein